MASFMIEGGHPLTGTIVPQGAKNEALQVICATLLTDEEVGWLNAYHARVYDTLSPHLDGADKDWLRDACAPIERKES